MQIEEFMDAGEHVVAVVRIKATGRTSGKERVVARIGEHVRHLRARTAMVAVIIAAAAAIGAATVVMRRVLS